MSFDAPRGIASFGSRRRLLSVRSRSARRPARRPSQRATSLASFRSLVWRYWEENGRHALPWRKTSDPYKVLVSEIMLQQTQVDRVVPKYGEFLREFPTVRALAKASLADVLKIWNGLGYNRRAKFLRDAAIEVVGKHGGKVPRDYGSLHALAGVGDYTARAVRVFAWNDSDILIETNIRTAIIHHFFAGDQSVAIANKAIDQKCKKLANLMAGNSREWYWALMDYGAHLKRSGVRNNHRSAHYVPQSKFKGSLRQARGAILRSLAQGSRIRKLNYVLIRANKNIRKSIFETALASLARDKLIIFEKGNWRIA